MEALILLAVLIAGPMFQSMLSLLGGRPKPTNSDYDPVTDKRYGRLAKDFADQIAA